ncbi:MAG TPA: glycosyltransferase family 2 protein [Gaiellaceae bacterium]
MRRDVTVVIGNYEGAHLLPECLASLERQTSPPVEVIVVDAGSLDGSRAVAESFGAQVVEMDNRGLGALYNRGVASAASPFVMLLNNDVSLDERCLEILRDALANPARFAADPRQMSWDGTAVVHARTTLTRGRMTRERFPGLHLDALVDSKVESRTVSAHGAAMMVRRSMMLELGGFDESFFMDFEDLDLCWRAWLRGWESVYVPEAWLRHKVGAVTTSAILPRRLASSHHNLTRFALKCLPARAAATVVAGEIMRLPVHPGPIGRGLFAVAREAREIARLRAALRPSRRLFEWMLGGQCDPGMTPADSR